MKRRTALTALASGLVLAGGCLEQPPADPGTATNTDTSTPDGESSRLTVTDVHAYRYAIRLNDLGESPGPSVPTVADLDERERAVVEAALDGTYRTESLSPWLVDFLDGTGRVRRDGQYYRIESELPTTTITARPVEREAVAGEIADHEAYRTAVTHDGLVHSGLLRIAKRDGEELTYVWPDLQDFLDRYDAAEYRGEVLDISVTRDDPGPPYTVTATEISLSELADGPVWRLETAEPAVQEVIRDGAAERGLYAFDDAPDGLLETLKQHRYVYVDGRFYTTYVEQAGSHPVSLRATAEGEDRIRLSLANDRAETVRISSGIPKPFGVLRYHEQGNPDDGEVLWSPAYAEHDGVQTAGRTVTAVNSVAIITEIQPNETVGRTFTVKDDIPPGQYVIEDSVGYEIGDENGTVPYEVRFQVG